VLKHIVRALPSDSTFVTASTGLAACALGGTTLHAFAGVGRSTDLASALLKASRLDARQRWNRATTLIVDEVSPPPPDTQ
jgi:ATP-dependent DNA helicase PIF1